VSGPDLRPEADAVQKFFNSFKVEGAAAPAAGPGRAPGIAGAGPGLPGGMPEFPAPKGPTPPGEPGKPASVVLSNARVTPERLGVQVVVDFKVEVPRSSPFEQFYLVLKTGRGKVYDMWATDVEQRREGTLQLRFLRVSRDERSGPFEVYLEQRKPGLNPTKQTVSNTLKVAGP
jgi:hypothetical protein